ncbi:DsbA family protein [Candidatus Curtissbacteria bacterium]|nr:DsbA family protein [Candidatus Curtissbacteria bacterium]
MSNEGKFFIGIGAVTLAVIIVGVVFFAGGSKSGETKSIAVGELTAGGQTLGESTASAQIVEFGDYQCPACGQAHPIVKQFLKDHGGSVYFVYRHFPLTQIHSNANPAARAAEAAGKQGKFWEMHDILFERQGAWSQMSDPQGKFEEYARELGLDLEKFKANREEAIGKINADADLGERAGVQSTPTFIINGQIYAGVLTYDKLEELTN